MADRSIFIFALCHIDGVDFSIFSFDVHAIIASIDALDVSVDSHEDAQSNFFCLCVCSIHYRIYIQG